MEGDHPKKFYVVLKGGVKLVQNILHPNYLSNSQTNIEETMNSEYQ